MSQVSIIDIEGNHPQIPTRFDANVGFAVPIANVLEILGDVVAAGTVPVQTVGSGNTITTNVQISQAIAASNRNNVGLSAFNSANFTVDADGFVSLLGGATVTSFNVDAHTAPGTDPVIPNGSGIITVTGNQVASGSIGVNVIRTNSLAANTYTTEIQRTSSSAATDITKNGVSHFNSAQFTVDSNGYVGLLGGGQAIDSIAVQTGTSPIAPTAAGLVTINGAVVAAGTNPIRSDGTGANTLALEVQISQAIAATDATKIGLSNFNSSHFSVDANGFVSLLGTLFLNYTSVNFAASPYTVLSTDEYISVDSSGGAVTLRFPNAPTTKPTWIVKDRTGSSATNNISVTTVGGVVTFDGSTTYTISTNYESIQLIFNGTSYEVY